MQEPDSAHIQVSDLQASRPKQQQNETIFDQKIVRPVGFWIADLQDLKLQRYQLGHTDSLLVLIPI